MRLRERTCSGSYSSIFSTAIQRLKIYDAAQPNRPSFIFQKMNDIRKLAPEVVQKIAAGEVNRLIFQ